MTDPGCLEVIPVTEENREAVSGARPEELELRLVSEPDVWLEAAYRALTLHFDRGVLDPYERYVEWLRLNRLGAHPFPFLMMVAYLRRGRCAYLVGVISGNVMHRIDYLAPPGQAPARECFWAVGHQFTEPSLRGMGIGTRLWQAAVGQARRWIEDRGCTFSHSVLEAEADSIGFWTKLGYLWPQGVRYWQPPLEFDSRGEPVRPEVPEVLLIRPMGEGEAPEIDRVRLQNIIATLYLNWSLDKYRKSLSQQAFERAEDGVMKSLFGRVCERMPQAERLKLVRIEMAGARPETKHYRSMALAQGAQHGLQPLRAPRLAEVNDFDQMLAAMKDMAFGARALGEAADVLYTMVTDPDCTVVLTLAGAVSVAKLDLIVAEMIQRGLMQAVITTGAVLCHGFSAERGATHFKVPQGYSDTWLFESGYDRIYDTIETEYAMDELQDIVHSILANLPAGAVLSSAELVDLLGRYLVVRGAPAGLIQAAHRRGVPVFVPAFTDSELGLDFALFNYYARRDGRPEVRYDAFLDFERYCELVTSSKTLGLIVLGGGVPRNFAQQIGPYLDAIARRENAIAVRSVRFKYGVRICPDPAYWGGLSGCTFSEGVSWGKFVPEDEGGRFAEVFSDFTFVFPLLIKGLFQRLDKSR